MITTDQNPDERSLSATSLSFIALRETVMKIWEDEVRSRVDGARDLLAPVLLNTLPTFYNNIGEALTPSHPKQSATSDNNAAAAHGGERARMTSFGVDQVIQEYQIFRESIRTAARGRLELGPKDWVVIDGSINSAVVEAVQALMACHEDLRKRVAASLSHDMRAPLAVIASGASLIGLSPDRAVVTRAAAKIEANALRLAQMVNELIDALTDHIVPEITLNLSEFDIQELINAVCDELNQGGVGQFKAAGCSVKGFWCKDAVRRILDNLASNAQKYGDGGMVQIKSEETHERLVLTVHNTGNHIPKARHDSIFKYLDRGEQSSNSTSWGIGLQYVRKAAEAHGGEVLVDSSQETGTTFTVDLPLDCRPVVQQ